MFSKDLLNVGEIDYQLENYISNVKCSIQQEYHCFVDIFKLKHVILLYLLLVKSVLVLF